MADTGRHKKVLVVGAHGRVGLLAVPRLIEEGHRVTGLIRDPGQQTDIEALGATALVTDVTDLTPSGWEGLLARFDVVVWAAGNSDGADPDATTAVDRDAAAASVDAAVRLGQQAPRYLMISVAGSLHLELDPDNALYTYARAKRAVDEKLLSTSGLDYLILAPGLLTTDPAHGVAVIANDPRSAFADTTSRELVAEVISEMVGRGQLPEEKILAFRDGDSPVWEL